MGFGFRCLWFVGLGLRVYRGQRLGLNYGLGFRVVRIQLGSMLI